MLGFRVYGFWGLGFKVAGIGEGLGLRALGIAILCFRASSFGRGLRAYVSKAFRVLGSGSGSSDLLAQWSPL